MRNVLFVALWVAMSLPAHAFSGSVPSSTTLAHAPLPLDATQEAIDLGYAYVQDGNFAAAATSFNRAVQSGGFALLSKEDQLRALSAAGSAALQGRQFVLAHDVMVRASGYPQAGSDVWNSRLDAAFQINDYADAADSLVTLIHRWPDILKRLNDSAIYQLDGQLQRDVHAGDVREHLLQSLFDAGWVTSEGQPDALWLELCTRLLARDEVQKAAAVAARIDSARVAITLLADKRFDRITRASPAIFDIDRMAAAQLAGYKAAAQAAPDRLQPVALEEGLLLDTLQFEQVVEISDKVIAHVRGAGASDFKDFDAQYIWILDQRARALARLGRWDEAEQQWMLAARRPEQGEMNVSQSINLGGFYAGMGKTLQAQEMVQELANLSPYGRMELELVKLQVALQRKDPAATAEHLNYLRTHRDDAIGAWQSALLLTNDLDAAGELLVLRLQNPGQRSKALSELQHYATVRMTPGEALKMARREQVLAQPKVQAALHKVGRILQLKLGPPQT